ncbi:hypothetical protein Tco_1091466 [Tanacetum coccineum]|uniref:Uncharacterized protein n=1 Tax=Tanacetum coccineum TaxID=301880 RepID=A0ABQ5I987_9ASTR
MSLSISFSMKFLVLLRFIDSDQWHVNLGYAYLLFMTGLPRIMNKIVNLTMQNPRGPRLESARESRVPHHLTYVLILMCRRTAWCSMEHIIAKYIAFRNKLKKDIKGSVDSLKKLDNMIFGSPLIEDLDNIHLLSVIRVFRDVNTSSNVIFQLLLIFLASPPLKKKATGRRSAVLRFLSDTKVVPV